MSLPVFGVWLTGGWEGDPGEVWCVPSESPGEALAWYRLNLPDLENKERGFLIPVVHPTARRNGIGRQLLRHAADRAAANGRTVLGSVAVQDSAGAAFAMAVGAKAGLVEARRLLDLRKVPAGEFARLRERAAAAATGYTVVSWAGPAPEEYLSLVAAAFNAMNDAPSDEGWEEEIWDADRVRDRASRLVRLAGVRGYSVAALHDATGELAALTQVEVDPGRPDWGYQGLTAVTRPHRGHRLGLLAKATMMEWLTTAEPQVERVVTGNAASNQHMIAVNETLGYELYPPGWQFCEIPVKPAVRAVPAEGMTDTAAIDALADSSGGQSGGPTTAASNLSRAADNPGQLRRGAAGRWLLVDTGAAIAHLPAAHLGDTGCQRRQAGVLLRARRPFIRAERRHHHCVRHAAAGGTWT